MKVVINTEYGQFALTDLGFERLLELKNIKWEKQPDEYFNYSVYFHLNHLGDDDYWLDYTDVIKSRADPDLVRVVEELGTLAGSSLKVVEIPDNIEWDIHEYDGIEWVAEKHRTWS